MNSPLEQIERETSPMRRYFFPALAVAVTLHVAFYGVSRATQIHAISPSYFNKLVPRTFTVKQVEIDPATLADAEPAATPRPKPKPIEDVAKLELGNKQPSLDDLLARADQIVAAPEVLDKSVVQPAPQLAPSDSLTKALAETPKPSDLPASEPGSLLDQLADRKPAVAGRPLLEMPKGAPGTFGGDGAPLPGQGNFSSLDGLLSQGGPVTDRTAPILLPTDLLYDYDSAVLRPEALDSLNKLGQLILRNPTADFLIEGHSDSFGAPAYNQTLSQRRAESVKQWLVSAMGIDGLRIQTRGFGSTRPLAAVGGSVEEQRLNRRVEIVIKTRRR